MFKRPETFVRTPNRRQFLSLTAAGLTMAGTAHVFAAKPKKPRPIGLGLQLWSIREEVAKDMDAALRSVADLGFQGVEFAGFHKYAEDPQGLRKKLEELGLKIAGSHVGASAFGPEKLQATIDFHKALGCRNLIVSGDKRFSDPTGSGEYIKVMNDAAKALKPAGLVCGHHNHTEEFKRVSDKPNAKTYWDVFFARTKKDVVIEHDIGWSTAAGLDPVALIKRFPGRTKLTHFKAKVPEGVKDKKPFIGQDVTDWRSVIQACDEVGGTEWFIVEQEDYPKGMSPMECVKVSFDGLKTILADMGRA